MKHNEYEVLKNSVNGATDTGTAAIISELPADASFTHAFSDIKTDCSFHRFDLELLSFEDLMLKGISLHESVPIG